MKVGRSGQEGLENLVVHFLVAMYAMSGPPFKDLRVGHELTIVVEVDGATALGSVYEWWLSGSNVTLTSKLLAYRKQHGLPKFSCLFCSARGAPPKCTSAHLEWSALQSRAWSEFPLPEYFEQDVPTCAPRTKFSNFCFRQVLRVF